jgi:hypothetical protein
VPGDQRTTNVGGAALLTAIENVTGAGAERLRAQLVKLGDIGETARFALRFPRILRIRRDKSPDEIDTIQTVARLAATSSEVTETMNGEGNGTRAKRPAK